MCIPMKKRLEEIKKWYPDISFFELKLIEFFNTRSNKKKQEILAILDNTNRKKYK